jgi:hypothetical protein
MTTLITYHGLRTQTSRRLQLDVDGPGYASIARAPCCSPPGLVQSPWLSHRAV